MIEGKTRRRITNEAKIERPRIRHGATAGETITNEAKIEQNRIRHGVTAGETKIHSDELNYRWTNRSNDDMMNQFYRKTANDDLFFFFSFCYLAQGRTLPTKKIMQAMRVCVEA